MSFFNLFWASRSPINSPSQVGEFQIGVEILNRSLIVAFPDSITWNRNPLPVLFVISLSQVWGGNPAKFLRKLTDEEIAFISQSATNYSNLAQVHAAENAKSFDEIEFEKVLRKKFARRDEEYDSMLGVVRETPQEIIVPDSIKDPKSLQK